MATPQQRAAQAADAELRIDEAALDRDEIASVIKAGSLHAIRFHPPRIHTNTPMRFLGTFYLGGAQ